MSGPEWYYRIPEERRLRYEAESEGWRALWWANRIRNPVKADEFKANLDRVRQELANEYPPVADPL